MFKIIKINLIKNKISNFIPSERRRESGRSPAGPHARVGPHMTIRRAHEVGLTGVGSGSDSNPGIGAIRSESSAEPDDDTQTLR